MHLRIALATLLALATVVTPAVAEDAQPADSARKRPNFVVVMTDDMRADDLRFMPAVRRLVGDRGLTFRNSFSPYPLCCPARTSFLTGQYAHNHGNLGNSGRFGFGAIDDRSTLATALHDEGYQTALVGKYLNLYGAVPSRVTGGPSLHYVPAGWTDWYASLQSYGNEIHGSTYHYFDTPFNVNGRVDNGHRGQYQTNVIGRFGRDLVHRYAASDKPFFLYLAPVAPHTGLPREPKDPWTATPARPNWVKGRFDRGVRKAPGLPRRGASAEQDVSDKPRANRHRELSGKERNAVRAHTRQRGEALFVLDHEVRRLISTLKRTGEYDDTVIVFTSDNGYLLGEHRFKAGKVKGYEPALRVPLVLAGPGIPQGVRNDPTTTFDLTATILDLAGAKAPHEPDGRSLVPAFTADQGWTAPVVSEGVVGGRRYQKAGLKDERGFGDARTSIGVRTARWKLTRYSTGEEELYDLDADPNELESLAAHPSYAGIRAQLLTLWWSYKDCRGEACRVPLPADLQASPAALAHSTARQSSLVHRRTGLGF